MLTEAVKTGYYQTSGHRSGATLLIRGACCGRPATKLRAPLPSRSPAAVVWPCINQVHEATDQAETENPTSEQASSKLLIQCMIRSIM